MILLNSSLNSFLQLLGAVIIFALVLLVTYLTTKWVGGFQKTQMTGKNLQVVESLRIGNNKLVQIIRVGEKYLVVAVGKEEVTMLAEVSAEELKEMTQDSQEDFQKLLSKLKERFPKKQG
jgi:flagellar protein FliO/FliZ